MEDMTTQGLDLYAQIKARLDANGLGDLASKLYQLIVDYGADMPETINAEIKKTEAYKVRFAGNEARIKAGYAALDEATYIRNEEMYRQTLSSYGMGDLATNDNFVKFIGGDISPSEMSDRIQVAVDKVNKADPALRRQLNAMYPGVSDSDLARSLLLGKEGAGYLKDKIASAEISAEADIAGYSLKTSASELAALGVNRQQAAQEMANIKSGTQGLTQASKMFGENVAPEKIQSELESERLLGRQSNRNKRLASQARGQLSGVTGIGQTSLGKRKQV